MKTLTKMGKMKLSQEWHERGGWLVLAGVATHSVERRPAYGMTVQRHPKKIDLGDGCGLEYLRCLY